MNKTGIGMGKMAQAAGVTAKNVALPLPLSRCWQSRWMGLLISAKMVWDYVDQKIIPTLQTVRISLGDAGGATDQLASQAIALGNELSCSGIRLQKEQRLLKTLLNPWIQSLSRLICSTWAGVSYEF